MPPVNVTAATPAPPIVVTALGNTNIKSSPGLLVSIANISTTAQPAGSTCTVWDNATNTPSGKQLFTENQIGPMQVITVNFTAINGLMVACTGAAPSSGAGLLVEYQ